MARDSRRNGSSGRSGSDDRLHEDPYADIGGDPVDLVAVRRDDAFIDAIAGDGPIATDDADQYQLALLLANWRAEIVTPALPSGPEFSTVTDAVDAEILATSVSRPGPTGRRVGFLRPIAGAAAAIAVALGGLIVVSYDSAPGDALWNVKSVVFSQQAESTVAQLDTTSKLQEAETLIASGDANSVQAVQELLNNASSTSGAVMDAAQRTELELWLARLLEQLQALLPSLPPLPASSPAVPPTDAAPVPPPANTAATAIPPTSVPAPPVEQLPVAPTTPAETPTELPQTTQAPVTTTPDLTIPREPASTTATASGQDVTPQTIDSSGGS